MTDLIRETLTYKLSIGEAVLETNAPPRRCYVILNKNTDVTEWAGSALPVAHAIMNKLESDLAEIVAKGEEVPPSVLLSGSLQ